MASRDRRRPEPDAVLVAACAAARVAVAAYNAVDVRTRAVRNWRSGSTSSR
jgi:hypothetical protein